MPNALTRALGFHPQPVPPPVIDLPDDNDLPVDEVKARLAELPRQRQQLAQDHADKIAPLLKERTRLEREIGSIDAQLAWQGILRQDGERELDRDQARLQALLVVRPVEDDARAPGGRVHDLDDDVDVDQRQVERIVARLKSGKLKRTEWVASTPEDEAAQLVYDGLVERMRAFARQAVQTRHASGHMPALPAELRGFSDTVRREIFLREGLA